MRELIKLVKSSKSIDMASKIFLVDYISDIKNNRKLNDFYEEDFLKSVILKLLASGKEDAITELYKTIDNVKFLLPLGTKTEGYEFYKELIINSDLVFDKELFSLFDNKIDYQQIVNIIKSNKLNEEQIKLAHDYAIEVSPLCSSYDCLKSEIISFVNGINSQINLEEYYQSRIKRIEKRNGIYDIDEKELSLISSEAEKATFLIKKLNGFHEQLTLYSEKIEQITSNGLAAIGNRSKEEQDKILNISKNSRIELSNRLNENLIELMGALKACYDELYEALLSETQVQKNEINKTGQNKIILINTETMKIMRATEESLSKIQNYVESDEVRQALKEIEKSEKAINNLVSLTTKEQVVEVKTEPIKEVKKEQIVEVKEETTQQQIKEYHRKVYPTIKLLGVKAPLISSFDYKIPARERFEKILELKEQREKNGELFHKSFDEVIKCVMQGDYTYLYGPSGCGKSYLAKQVATVLGLEATISDQVADQYGIKGYKDAQGNFQPTQAYDAFVKGKMLIVNEFDNSNSQAQVVLNTLYDALRDVKSNPYTDSFVTFADDVTVPVNPNFRILCTGNTDLNGPNKVFQRTKSDGAVEKRIKFIELSYDQKIEDTVLKDYPYWASFITNFRKLCEIYSYENLRMNVVVGDIGSRNVFDIATALRDDIKTSDEILTQEFIRNKDKEFLQFLVKNLSEMYEFRSDQITRQTAVDEITLAKRLVFNINKKLTTDAK